MNITKAEDILYQLFNCVENFIKHKQINKRKALTLTLTLARKYEFLTNTVITAGSYIKLFDKHEDNWKKWNLWKISNE